MEEELELVTVFVTDYLQALVLKSRLESEGIPVLLSYGTSGTGGSISFEGFAVIELKVPLKYVYLAKRILEDIENE